jgi:DNA-binding transcriptional LysR family regulator
MRTFDLTVLRTFVAVVEGGTLAAAAARIGRSESAVSLQMKKLEETVGEAVFDRSSRTLTLTETGSTVLAYARRLLDLNDEAVLAADAHGLAGEIRIGVPQDFADTWLPAMIGRFRRSHPGIKVNVSVDRSVSLEARVKRGEIDLALVFGEKRSAPAAWSAKMPMTWIGRPEFTRNNGESISLVVFDPPCAFRAAAIAALDRAGIAWSVTFTSVSLAGLWAAVDAGLGISVRTPAALPPHLTALGRSAGLPPLPKVILSLHAAPLIGEAGAYLRRVLIEGLTTSLAGSM